MLVVFSVVKNILNHSWYQEYCDMACRHLMHLLYSAVQIVLLEQLYCYTILQYSIELYMSVCV